MDVGSGWTRMGLAGEDKPSCSFPSVVGRIDLKVYDQILGQVRHGMLYLLRRLSLTLRVYCCDILIYRKYRFIADRVSTTYCCTRYLVGYRPLDCTPSLPPSSRPPKVCLSSPFRVDPRFRPTPVCSLRHHDDKGENLPGGVCPATVIFLENCRI